MIVSPYALALWLVMPVAAAPAPADNKPKPFDWPQWRGPNRDDVSRETGLLKSWGKDGPPLAWKVGGLGGGYSTPSVAAGRIFGMSYRGDDEVVWCLDEANGKELWVTTIAAKGKVGMNAGSRSTPTIDGDRAYAVGVSGDLVCLNVKDGSVAWRKNYAKDFGGRMMSGWGFSESPLVDGDRLICTPGGDKAAVAALDKLTGKTVWTAAVPKAGGAGYSSLMPAEVGGVKMYVTLLGKSGGVVGVRAKDGKLLWQYTRIVNRTANIPTVIVRDDLVLASTGYPDGGTALLKLTADGSGGVKVDEVKYYDKELQNHHGGMVRVGDYVYFGRGHNNGLPTCIEFKTGNVVWKEPRGAGSGSAGVTYADGMLYFRHDNGMISLVEATPKKYHLVSSFMQPERTRQPAWAHPVIANGKLYIRDQDTLFCYDVKATN